MVVASGLALCIVLALRTGGEGPSSAPGDSTSPSGVSPPDLRGRPTPPVPEYLLLGSVVDAGTSRHLSDVQLHVSDGEREESSSFPSGRLQFSLSGAAGRSVRLRLGATGYRDAELTVNLSETRRIDLGTIRLESSTSINLVWDGPAPQGAFWIQLQDASSEGRGLPQWESLIPANGAERRAVVSGVPAGELVARAWSQGSPRFATEAVGTYVHSGQANEIRLTFRVGIPVRGSVQVEGGGGEGLPCGAVATAIADTVPELRTANQCP